MTAVLSDVRADLRADVPSGALAEARAGVCGARPGTPWRTPARPLAAATARPRRLALVLGSGGVRSIAAVGLVDSLQRHALAPDLIVGCSSGALFGATIALGMSPAEALRAATSLWSADLTGQRRWRAYPQMLAPRLAGFDEDFALRENGRIAARLHEAFGEARLESLAVPLRVVATDAAGGRRVVLERGRLVDALLASMALPFLFPSVEVEGRRLVDGVISDPLPVSAAADAELLLTLGFEGAMPRRVDRPSRLAAQATTALMNNLMQARLDAARAAGQRLLPVELQLDRHVGLWETAAMPMLCDAGRQAGEQVLPWLQAWLTRLEPRPGLHAHREGRPRG